MQKIKVRYLGLVDYLATMQQMQSFTAQRDDSTDDELWLLQHMPVFTQGQAGKSEHILDAGDIPIVQADRGGQVTYHGPGQYVLYVLIDVQRLGISVRSFVSLLEKSVVALLGDYGISGVARQDAPGVYVDEKKIASIGLRVRRGKSYHGMSLNIDMDLAPFARINPCGYQGMAMTQLKSELTLAQRENWDGKTFSQCWLRHVQKLLAYDELVCDDAALLTPNV